ncbi:hypothetical protein AAFF_G00164090 [Aldrovandia affinis]|uniref:Uncharacterized protein n=1 Tax=Aldrovandia affinis TaxID=143900 RepID=A0AAD7SZE5_9TELE|nr:hypothetical protein AAFF_G00164090 [Aldrovandia affinis]
MPYLRRDRSGPLGPGSGRRWSGSSTLTPEPASLARAHLRAHARPPPAYLGAVGPLLQVPWVRGQPLRPNLDSCCWSTPLSGRFISHIAFRTMNTPSLNP